MQGFLLVGAGGALGAMGRYGLDLVVGRMMSGTFPVATLLANVVGSLVMGVLVGLLARFTPGWQAGARLFLAVGLLGGFTTFSSFSLDTVTLIERGQTGLAFAYVAISVIVCIAALFAGLVLIRSVS